MAEWYVDANQVGGNGTHPASSFPSVLSITWAPGDRAWLRRTHYETLPDSATPGPNFVLDTFARFAHVIGWPDSGDPFFDERPAAGVTSGWDADVPSTSVYSVYGLKFPTLNNSNNAAASGISLPRGAIMANIAFQNSGGPTFTAWRDRTDFQNVMLDNVIILSAGGATTRIAQALELRFGKMWMVSTGAPGTSGLFTSGVYASHLVLHDLSVVSGGMFRGTTFNGRIDHLEIRTNSVDYLATAMGGIISNLPVLTNLSIGRCSGSAPYSGDALRVGLSGSPLIAVDDYFGTGPRIINASKPGTFFCSSVQGMHNGSRVLNFSVSSENAANMNYQSPIWRLPALKKYFQVTSGTAANFRIPVYADSTGVFSLSGGLMQARLVARGAKAQYNVKSNMLVGSPTLWSGSFVAGGSAYLWEVKFLPQETGLVPLEVYLPPVTQATSGQPLVAYALFSEPYSS